VPARSPIGFDTVRQIGRTLPDVEANSASETLALKARGKLLACQAVHRSAEPDTLMVRIDIDRRAELIDADPDVYYVTDHYVNYPSVLVRLSRIDRDALRDLLGMSWRFVTSPKKSTQRLPGTRTRRRPTR
jgi:hypothetical protein